MKMKRFFSVAATVAVMASSIQIMQPSTAEAGFLDNLGPLKGIVETVTGTDESGIQKTYESMVNNYYAAAYYSDRAAVIGIEILKKYNVPVSADVAAVVNSSTDSSDAMVQKTANMQVTTMKTDMTELSDFVEVAKKFDPNDDLIRRFRLNKEFQEKALNDARSDTALLVGKQALVGKAGEAVVQCITTALWYNKVQSQFEAATGNSCNLLNKAIKKDKRLNVKVDKKVVKDAIKNVPKG